MREQSAAERYREAAALLPPRLRGPAEGLPPGDMARAEELLALGLDVPQITRLFLRLRELGMDVDPAVYTVEQAKRQLLGRKGGAAKC